MTTTSPREYKKIDVTGPVSVERVNRISDPDLRSGTFYTILIMGPTGAGKSTFIESFGLVDAEAISSNRLEGFTQSVSTYRITGVTYNQGRSIYLIDSPGFADTKISEMSIVSMLQKWRKDNGDRYFTRILYLTPITQIRLPRSQRQVLKTFQALTGANSAINISIVTTMWDSLGGERGKTQAETTYTQLESDIWKDFIEQGAQLVQFRNTKDSSLDILDEAMHRGRPEWFNVEMKGGRTAPFADNIYADLQDRIQNLQWEVGMTQSAISHAEVQGDDLLRSVLIPRLEESKKYLKKFQRERQAFGPPPPGLHSSDSVPEPGPLRSKLAGNEEEGVHAAMGVPTSRAPSTSQPLHVAQEISQPQRGRRLGALDLLAGCGCCGRAVEANHDL